jgi:hypothetical protein
LGLLIALIIGYTPCLIHSWGRTLGGFADSHRVYQGITEVNRALATNPGLKISVGPGHAKFNAEWLHVLTVFRGNPLPIDSIAWEDYVRDHLSDAVVRRAIRDCRVDLWLLPTGAPFVKRSTYDGREIYPPDVLAEFHATYRLVKTGAVFDEWRCIRGQSRKDTAGILQRGTR